MIEEVECLECGKILKSIPNHLKKKHNMITSEYLLKYPNALLTSEKVKQEMRNSHKIIDNMMLPKNKIKIVCVEGKKSQNNRVFEKYEVECEMCEHKIIIHPYKLKQNRYFFCSRNCFHRSKKIKTKSGITVNCTNCGTEIYKNRHRLKRNKSQHYFCSHECFKVWYVGSNNSKYGIRGSKHPRYKITKCVCKCCFNIFDVKPYESIKRKFCSYKCSSDWRKICPRENFSHTEKSRKKMRLSAIKRIKDQYGQIFPNYSLKACKLFNNLNRFTGWNGQHAENGGEFYIEELGYFVDYYEKNLNLILEYDEPHHYNSDGTLREKDLQRQKEITEFLGCKFIRIKRENLSIVYSLAQVG